MAIAFMQMVVEPGKEEEIKEKLMHLDYLSCKVEEAYMTYGEFDVVIKVTSDSVENINHFVMKIREVEGIKRTVTSLVYGTLC
jgi:anthranilate phosphoribosyltransferase